MIENMKPVFSFHTGQAPLLISVPHSGTGLSEGLHQRLTQKAQQLPDTDWYVDRLYQWAKDLGAAILVANYSRFVIDLNRSSDNKALYAGHGTGLLPEHCFDGSPVYLPDMHADEAEQSYRLQTYWQPYHDQLKYALHDIRQQFGYAILLDAHSIRSVVPKLFSGILPDLNLGTYKGSSADPSLISTSFSALSRHSQYSSVLDGRFQGGYITRNYGRPDEGIHALQLEMAQTVYMQEQPPVYQTDLAEKASVVLRDLVTTLIEWSPA